ncbi:3-dehydroquinate synthase [Deferribacter autotrophicus]|uniref:3-dehydroquinate synthase n=1 Tax=Deferribacter autotrophicus TaxID=500465 RepID=A0A5A8F4U8_9BACT|nr:3-dehydroquinate synthase [Deferribacter autotrophicus]KAA0258394.1 3-dehydroquinate synthase [Deferribacter autotrophicus]
MSYNLFVNLKKEVDYSYPIIIEKGCIKNVLEMYHNSFYLIDSKVYSLYESFFENIDKKFIFEASEENKKIESVLEILKWLKDEQANRSSKLIVLGGGITGDVGGFAASLYMRGINFIQVPTTLLSMVDSSVGGKTGVNFENRKNFIGSFKQPEKVFIDTAFLSTLADDEYKNGLAEVIKYSLMFDEEFYEFLLSNRNKIAMKKNETVMEMIYRCCKHKADVVRQDELESGIRKFLNFGHTIGHAIEVDSNYSIKHGFAVAIGMYLETLVGVELGEVSEDTLDFVKKILSLYGFDYTYKIKNKDLFINAMMSDKKIENDGLVLSLTNRIGAGKIITGIKLDDVVLILEKTGVFNG